MRGNKVGRGANATPATAHRRDGLVPDHRRDVVERQRQRRYCTALRRRRRMRRRVRGDMGGRIANVTAARRLLTTHHRDGMVPAHRHYGPVAVHHRVDPFPAPRQHGLALEETEEEGEEGWYGWTWHQHCHIRVSTHHHGGPVR